MIPSLIVAVHVKKEYQNRGPAMNLMYPRMVSDYIAGVMK